MAWADETLAVFGDVRERYIRVGDLCESDIEAEQNTEITEMIAKSKEFIGRKLDLSLSGKLKSNYEASDLKDLILNAEVLEASAVARTLALFFENAEMSDDDYNAMKKREFMAEYKEEFTIAVSLIQFDEDESGSIDDDEKDSGLGAHSFFRV